MLNTRLCKKCKTACDMYSALRVIRADTDCEITATNKKTGERKVITVSQLAKLLRIPEECPYAVEHVVSNQHA
jgi:hypothetical protein